MMAIADRADRRQRQVDRGRQQHHAPADHPDHAGQHVVGEVDVERPRDADDGELEEHEPQAAHDQESRQRGAVHEPSPVQKRGGAGEEDEGRRDEVRDPAREEDAGGRPAGRQP